MRKLLALVALIFALSIPAHAETITVQAHTISNWQLSATGTTVTLKYELDQDGIDAGGSVRMRGSGPSVTCTVTTTLGVVTLNIPSHTIESTTDWLRPRYAKYNPYFILPGGRRVAWNDFIGSRIPATPTTTTFAAISIYNKSAGPELVDEGTYSKTEVNFLINQTTSNPLTAVGDVIYGGTIVNSKATLTRLAIGTNGQVLQVSGGLPAWGAVPTHAHTGSDISGLTSADFTSFSTEVNSALSLSGIQTALGFVPENSANKNATNGYAGLVSGKILSAQVTEVIPVTSLSDVDAAAPADGDVLKWNDTMEKWEASPDAGAGGGSGSVTSAAMSVPAFLSVAGSPITTSGTFNVTLATQTANMVFVGPTSGGAATPTFRALVSDDIPSLDAAKITTGTVATARLGSGVADATTFLRGNQTYSALAGADIPDLTATYLGLAAGGTVAAGVKLDYSAASNFSGGDSTAYHKYQIAPTRSAFATKGSYAVDYTEGGGSSGMQGNIFHFSSYVENSGTRPVVAVYGGATGTGNGAQAWAFNPVAYTEYSGVGTSGVTAHAIEGNFGALGTSTYQRAYGIVLAAISDGDTPATASDGDLGVNQAYLHLQVSNGFTSTAAPRNGISFVTNAGSVAPVNGTLDATTSHGALIYAQGVTANFVINASGGDYYYGIDFAGTDFADFGGGIRFANNERGIVFANAANTTALAGIKMDGSNFVVMGDPLPYGGGNGVNGFQVDIDGVPAAFQVTSTISTVATPLDVKAIRTEVSAVQVANYTALSTDSIIRCNGTFSVSLPAAAGLTGHEYTIVQVGTGTITIDPNASETISGAATDTSVNAQWESLVIYSDSANWIIKSRN
jgi:hypothetical protein